ncbi:MAG: HEAT repeat domain-containing protein [Leptolyngbyaceae cyanobacterium]
MKLLILQKLGRYFILSSMLFLSSSCSLFSLERIGDRGDCKDVSNGMSQYDVHVLRGERDDIDIEKLLTSLASWNSTTRYKSLLILISNTDPTTLLPNLRIALQDKDPRVRATSIEGLATAAASQETLLPEVLPILTQGTQDEDPGIRLSSFDGLTEVVVSHQTLSPQLVPLIAHGLKDSSACVRAKTVFSADWLISVLDSSNAEIKAMILDLITVASSDSSVWARRHALGALSDIDVASEEIIPTIVNVLKHHPDSTVRSAAAYALMAKEANPASTEALLAAINDENAPVRSMAAAALFAQQPTLLISQDALSTLSDTRLGTAIWYVKRRLDDLDVTDESKADVQTVFNVLAAEHNSRLNK